jgi:hypothetical protein
LGGGTRPLVALLTAIAVVAAACGSDGGRLSVREFTQRASTSCSRADHRAASRPIPSIDDRHGAAAITRLIRIERQVLDELHGLVPPKHLRSRVDEWLATVDQLLVETEFLRESLREHDGHVAEAIAVRAARLALRSQVLAAGLGIRGCTMPTPPPVDPSDE